MISRRDALKMAAAGVVAPTLVTVPNSEAMAAQDQPASVTMFRGNAARTGEMPGPGPRPEKPIAVRWQLPWGSPNSAPAIKDGVMYCPSDNLDMRTFESQLMVAIDQATGEEIWKSEIDTFPASSPTINGDTVLIGGSDKNLYAFDTANGDEIWRFDVGGEEQSSPLVIDDIAYVSSSDGNVYAIDADTGLEVWRFTTGGPALSSPASDNKLIYIGSNDGNLYAIDAANGLETWRFSTENHVRSTPAYHNGTVFVTSSNGLLYAVNSSTGLEKWRFDVGTEHVASPTVSEDTVFIGGGESRFHAIDSANGTERWQFVAEEDKHVPVFSASSFSDGSVYFGDDFGRFFVLDSGTGGLQWSTPRTDMLWQSSAPLVIDGHVYISAHETYVGSLTALGNLPDSVLAEDVTLRGAPSPSGVERGTAKAGDQVDNIGTREERGGTVWAEVTIGDVTGWIPVDAIDPATLPPEGEIEYVYVPE